MSKVELHKLCVSQMSHVPNIFIIGAQKCGTTSLHYYLSELDDVFPVNIKECSTLRNFNSVKSRYANVFNLHFKDIQDYNRKVLEGYNNEKYILESTTQYTTGTLAEKERIPEVMKLVSPQAKIIYILRNPIERLVSNYVHNVKMGRFSGDMHAYFSKNQNWIILTSCYGYQLSQYLSFFSRDNILVLDFNKLTSHPNELLIDVFRFLDIPEEKYKFPACYKVHNSSVKSAGLNMSHARFKYDSFQSINNTINADIQTLKNLGVDFSWDVSPETWCDTKQEAVFDAFPIVGHLYLNRNPNKESFFKFFKVAKDTSSLKKASHKYISFLKDTHININDIISEIKNALSVNTENPYLYRQLGDILKKTGDLEGAKEAHGKAIDLDASISGPHKQLSHIYNYLSTLIKRVGRFMIRLPSNMTILLSVLTLGIFY